MQKLLILDLDETLVHATPNDLGRECDFKVFEYNGFLRPYLKEFLIACNKEFELAIWSSASDDYVVEVVNIIKPEEVDFSFVWGKSRCTYRRNFGTNFYLGINDDYFPVKNLKKLKRKGYSLDNILIVDDSPSKATLNYGNAIYPTAYEGNVLDDELPYLYQYLLQIKNKSNFRAIEKRNWKNEVYQLPNWALKKPKQYE